MKTNEERIKSMIQTAGDGARYQAMGSMRNLLDSIQEATIQRN